MPKYRALVTYTVKVSVGLTFEAADRETAATVVRTIVEEAVPFAIQETRVRHELGAIEMWDSDITGFSVGDIVEDADAV